MSKLVNELIKGAYDLHVHSYPDMVPRKLNDIELALEAKKVGMHGILIKNHHIDTTSRTYLVKQIVKGISIFGGITLNNSVGGLNPDAVDVSLKLGAKEIWMPTVDSLNHRSKIKKEGGIYILDEKDDLRKEIYEILESISKYQVILGTGHLSLKEIFTLIKKAKEMKIEKIVVTHPEFWITYIPIKTQLELSKYGVFFERCYYSSTLNGDKRVDFKWVIECIKKVGLDSTIISTDLGQKYNPSPVEGMKVIISELLEANFRESEIRKVISDNPKSLVT